MMNGGNYRLPKAGECGGQADYAGGNLATFGGEQHGRKRAAPVPGLGEVLEHFTELFLADGFHEIGIGAKRVRLVNVGLLIALSENDDWQFLKRRIAADPAENFQPAEARQVEIQQEQVGER